MLGSVRCSLLTVCFALAVPFTSSLAAQSGTPAAATGALVDPAKSLDAALSSTEKELVPLAEAMPAEKYGFAPANTNFTGGLQANFTGVSSFGQEVAHAAQANFYFGSVIGGLKPTVDVKAIGTGVDKATAVASLKDSFAFLHQAVATLNPANAFEHVGARNPLETRISVLMTAIGHNNNHYGQLVEYLRMNGLTPPASQGRAPVNAPKAK